MRFDLWVGKIPCRGEWQSTPVFLPAEFQGQRSLGGLQSIGSHKVGHDWSNLAEHIHNKGNGTCYAAISLWGAHPGGRYAPVLSHFQLFMTLWTVARQPPLSMGFSRQEYWSRSPCPPPGDLPNSEIKPRSSALQADSLLSELSGKPMELIESMKTTYIDHQIYFNLLFNFKLFGYLQSFRWLLIGPTIVHLWKDL